MVLKALSLATGTTPNNLIISAEQPTNDPDRKKTDTKQSFKMLICLNGQDFS
jgi:hypothetical protein